MDDRRQDEGPDDRGRGERESGQYEQGGTSAMTRSRQGREVEGQRSSSGGGEWQGYVVPYRYYGPGYRGVGYYSVMYQGSGSGSEQDYGDERRWSQPQEAEGRQGAFQGVDQGWSSRGRGGYAGRGPKGYQRSDDRLRDDVCDRLMEDDSIDASDVDVQVRSGEVTLSGTVADRWMKRRAEDLAEQVMGVRDVMNQVRVQGERGSAEPGTATQQGSSKGQREPTSTRSGEHEQAPNGRRRPASSGTR